MDAALPGQPSASERDRELAATAQRERARLLAFIRRRIADAAEAEDVLQEALYELVRADRMLQPVEEAGAWLMQVARHRITDWFRRRRPQPLAERTLAAEPEVEDAEELEFEELVPAADEGPESHLMRELLLEEIGAALEELPPEQREVFAAHELEGVSFRELAARSGVSINTLLARKRYAVAHLRERLRETWDEWLLP
jgi:RNA polymerase sigma factor (sigma-70 family)